MRSTHKLRFVFLATVGLAVTSGEAASGQFINPRAAALARQQQLYALRVMRASGGWGYPYPVYYNTWYSPSPEAIARARATYQQSADQARLAREKAYQERVRTRRMVFDQRVYELRNGPSDLEIRQRKQEAAVARAMSGPPEDEVLSGQALNTLLPALAARHGQNSKGKDIPLAGVGLDHINLVPGQKRPGAGNPGLLKKGDLDWPTVLLGERFNGPREAFDKAFDTVVSQISSGEAVGAATRKQLDASLRALRVAVEGAIQDLALADSMQAMEYLRVLEKTVSATNDPALLSMVKQGKTSPQAKTAGELVDWMSSNGFWFAPATPGDRAAYLGLHSLLVQYGLSMDPPLSTERAANAQKE